MRADQVCEHLRDEIFNNANETILEFICDKMTSGIENKSPEQIHEMAILKEEMLNLKKKCLMLESKSAYWKHEASKFKDSLEYELYGRYKGKVTGKFKD